MNENSEEPALQFTTPFYAKLYWGLTSAFIEKTSLGQILATGFLRLAPERYKRALALRVLSMSTHYFIYYRSNKYPRTMSRRERLEAENNRMASSRKIISEQILRRHIGPEMTVLDFGCGPGYLARQVASYSKSIIGVDISRSAIACARVLNGKDNIDFVLSKGKDFPVHQDSCIDTIYTFAVFQHVEDSVLENVLGEFFRILNPGGKVVAHFAISDNPNDQNGPKKSSLYRYFKEIVAPPMVFRTVEAVTRKITNAGFKEPEVTHLKEACEISDDIGNEHIFVFLKPQ